MDPLIGLVAGTGWASGLNVYLVGLLVGVAGRAGWIEAPAVLTQPAVLAAVGGLLLVDLVADKVPLLDSLWDVAHTVIRPVGAGLIAIALTGEREGVEQALAAGGSGALALAAHAAKATLRAAINTSPEPASNALASLTEDGLAAGTVALAILAPAVALVLVLVLLAGGGVLTHRLWRAARRGLERVRRRRVHRRGAPGAPEPRDQAGTGR